VSAVLALIVTVRHHTLRPPPVEGGGDARWVSDRWGAGAWFGPPGARGGGGWVGLVLAVETLFGGGQPLGEGRHGLEEVTDGLF
jgi:hypothetical protein